MLIGILSANFTFDNANTCVNVDNIEALAENEVNIFELCKKAGGHCMVSITMDVYGISIED